jgi:hypothetical protein
MIGREHSHLTAADWNKRLIEAVFSTRSGQTPIRIINATDGYLAHVAGMRANAEVAARRSFVRSIMAIPYGTRRIFDHDLQMALWRQHGGAPTFFVQLYLSLLAASASEDTHEEGDFRRRYCLLLNLPPGNYVSNGLPRLWEELARWSRAEAQAGHAIRRLVLPDPGYETIIGYSKRLAFPGFRDLGRLATVLFSNDLTSESPLDAIVAALAPKVSTFSSNFQSEYAHLRRALDDNPESVFLVPLWAALEAASFSPRDGRIFTRASFALELSFDEFGRPLAFLFTNSALPRPLRATLHAKPASRPVGECGLQVTIPHGERETELLLGLLDPKHPLGRLLRASALRRQLDQSCLVFAPDQDVPWLWRASLPLAGPAIFLCDELAYEVLSAAISRIGLDRVNVDRVNSASGWYLVELADCASLRGDVCALSELRKYDALCRGVGTPRLTFRGAVHVSDGLLLNTASRPEVIVVGCDRVSLSVSYEAGSAVQLGDLARDPQSGVFRPTIDQVSRSVLPAALSLAAYRGEELIASRELIATNVVQLNGLTSGIDVGDYLEESGLGQYAMPGAAASSTTEWVENPNFDAAVSFSSQAIEFRDSTFFESIDLDPVVPVRWYDLVEALYGVFANAKSCSDDRLEFLSDGLSSVQREFNRFSISTHLWHNLFLSKLWHRRWRGARYFALAPRLEFDSEEGTVRLLGLVSRGIRHRFCQVSGVPLSSSVQEDAVAFPRCIEAANVNRSYAQELASSLEVPLVERETLELPSLSELFVRLPVRYRPGMPGLQVRVWSTSAGAFLEAPRSDSPVVLKRTDYERAQPIFELIADDCVLWATESRAWALFALRSMSGEPSIVVRGSSVVSSQPLPLLVAWAARSSGGRTHLGPGSRSPRWVYQFRSRQALRRFLGAWVPQTEESAAPLARWVASARAKGSSLCINTQQSLVRRYGRSS